MKLTPGKLYTARRKFKFMDATAKGNERETLGQIEVGVIVMFVKKQEYVGFSRRQAQEVVFLYGDRLITGAASMMDECPEVYFKETQIT